MLTTIPNRDCMRNARTAHAFAHWKYHLNDWVVDHLKDRRELTSGKIVTRDGWSTKKRRKDAERIVDEMETEGEIKSLYKDFRLEIDTAQMANNVCLTRRYNIARPLTNAPAQVPRRYRDAVSP